MSEDPSWQYEESMKDAPINLPPLPDDDQYQKILNAADLSWQRSRRGARGQQLTNIDDWKWHLVCAAILADRATVLADRAGREAYCPNCDCGYCVGMYQPAAPSAAEFKTILERAYEAVKATNPPAPPNWKELAEPPAAPVQEEPVAWQDVQQPWDLYRTKPLGIDVRPLYTRPDADLRARIAELERLCDATYVAQGADAYNHATDEMERWQRERLAAGREAGCEGSLCDGMAWLYGALERAEAERDQLRALLREARDWWLDPLGAVATKDLQDRIDAAISGSK